MSGDPDYNPSVLTLKARIGQYALFQERNRPLTGRVNRYSDGEWEIFEKGTFAEMSTLFYSLTGSQEIHDDLAALTELEPVPVVMDEYATNPRFGRF